jgi:hypothetical protein
MQPFVFLKMLLKIICSAFYLIAGVLAFYNSIYLGKKYNSSSDHLERKQIRKRYQRNMLLILLFFIVAVFFLFFITTR